MILQEVSYDLIHVSSHQFWAPFHMVWDGTERCLYCVAEGSEASTCRRHTCVCSLLVAQFICDILPVRNLELCLGKASRVGFSGLFYWGQAQGWARCRL
jgi:hypothetical protein